MNVYDFDNTIYDGDSTVDFYFFCLRKKPVLIKYVFNQLYGFILYFAKKCDKTELKQRFHSFLRGIDDTDAFVRQFWEMNSYKIKDWYKQRQQSDDVIISASAEFLLTEQFSNIIGSKVDKHTGIYNSKNCYGEEKVKRFFEKFPQGGICEFYSDSYSDSPMAAIAEKAFYIKKNSISEWKIAKE